MSNVTAYPTALLDLLKVRDRGQMPGDLSNVVSLSIEALPLYLNNQRETRTDTQPGPTAAGFNVVNNTGQLLVPPGEIWYVHHYFVAATLTALQALHIAAAIRTPGNVNAQLGPWDRQPVGAINLASSYAEGPFWAVPGTEFGAVIGVLTAGPMTLVATAHVTRLRL